MANLYVSVHKFGRIKGIYVVKPVGDLCVSSDDLVDAGLIAANVIIVIAIFVAFLS